MFAYIKEFFKLELSAKNPMGVSGRAQSAMLKQKEEIQNVNPKTAIDY